MKRKHLPLVLLIIAILAIAFIELLKTLFGADKVFIGTLISIPFLLIWCIRTDPRKSKT